MAKMKYYNGTSWVELDAKHADTATEVTGAQKTKLDGIAVNANNYVHPTTHPPSIIAQDTNNRFVTDAEKTLWNSGTGGSSDLPFASAIGLVPNSKAEAQNNINKIITALNTRGALIIDDYYYVKSPSVALTATQVSLTGLGGGFIFDETTEQTLFDPAVLVDFEMRDLRITNLSTVSARIAYNNTQMANALDTVIINNCFFEGNIRFYQMIGSYTQNPLTTFFGLKNFSFINNTVKDTTSSFINLTNVPVEDLQVSNNKVTNFVYTFLNFATENTSTNTDQILLSRKNATIENNFVFCEKDWWGLTGAGTYFVFALVENDTVVYKGNHVEGLKTTVDIALYDCYLSSRVVHYFNNTWKNNIIFTTTKTNNYLLKSKGGIGEMERFYKNNTFIVEKDFAESLGQTNDKLFVQFLDLTAAASDYIIEGNLFDLYEIRGRVSSVDIKNFVMSGNTFRGVKASDNLVQLKVDGIGETAIIRNNIIDFPNTDSLFRLLRMFYSDTNLFQKVLIENNYVRGSFEYIFYNIRSWDFTLLNNKFISTRASGQTSGVALGGKYINSQMENNTFERVGTEVLYETRDKYVEGNKFEFIKFNKKNSWDTNNSLHLANDISLSTGQALSFRRKYKVYTNSGLMSFVASFSVILEDGVPHVTFVDETDTLQTFQIGTTEGNLTYLKRVDVGEITNTLQFRFYNSATSTYLSVNNFNDNKEWMEVETTCVGGVFEPAGGTDITINIADIGLSVPQTDGIPQTTVDTEQYSGTVSWSPVHNPFQVDTIYTATVTLTAKTGYTLTGVAQNFFTSSGLTLTNSANSGVITAVAPVTVGSVGVTSLLFDPSGTYVDFGNPTAVNNIGTGDFTIEAWVRNKNTIISSDYHQPILGKSTFATGDWGLALSGYYADHRLTLTFDSTTLNSTAGITLNDDTWHHVAVSRAGTTITFFIDGVQTDSVTGVTLFSLSNAKNMVSGARIPFSGNRKFNGNIDEIRLWSVARTELQISTNKDTTLVGNETGLVGYWKFDEETGTTALDSTANGINGTLVGPVYSTDVPF